MDPGLRRLRARNYLPKWIELTGVHFARLQADNGRGIQLWKPAGIDAPALISWSKDQLGCAEAEDAQRFLDGNVDGFRNNHADRRCADEAVLVEIPSRTRH